MKSLYRRLSLFLVILVILVAGYVAYRFVAASRTHVPQEFSDARTQGALISEKIVANSNEVAFDIAHLNENAANYEQVSSTIGDILNKTADIRQQALDLLSQLSTMAQALPEIRSADAREAALQSISQRFALVSDLNAYSDQVARLAELLRLHIKDHVQNTQEIDKLIQDINSQVTAINSFNRAANDSMVKFDSLLR